MRGNLVESRHRGHVVVVKPDGEVTLRVGDVDRLYYPRSTNKPLQTVALVGLGLDVAGDLLAVACASHAGLPMHVDAVRRLLAHAGLTDDDLDNTPDLPLDGDAARALLISGGGPDRVHQNCSGNHAAMLATCVVCDWPTDGYRDPEHPLQAAIRATYESFARTTVGPPTVDGCGAPLYAMSLVGLATAYSTLVTDRAPAVSRVRGAMLDHPQLVDGPGRASSELMLAVPGLIAKGGAEGMFAVALPDGRGLAVKIEDGGARAVVPVVVRLLRELGVDDEALHRWASAPVFGHGEVVGEVRAVR